MHKTGVSCDSIEEAAKKYAEENIKNINTETGKVETCLGNSHSVNMRNIVLQAVNRRCHEEKLGPLDNKVIILKNGQMQCLMVIVTILFTQITSH